MDSKFEETVTAGKKDNGLSGELPAADSGQKTSCEETVTTGKKDTGLSGKLPSADGEQKTSKANTLSNAFLTFATALNAIGVSSGCALQQNYTASPLKNNPAASLNDNDAYQLNNPSADVQEKAREPRADLPNPLKGIPEFDPDAREDTPTEKTLTKNIKFEPWSNNIQDTPKRTTDISSASFPEESSADELPPLNTANNDYSVYAQIIHSTCGSPEAIQANVRTGMVEAYEKFYGFVRDNLPNDQSQSKIFSDIRAKNQGWETSLVADIHIKAIIALITDPQAAKNSFSDIEGELEKRADKLGEVPRTALRNTEIAQINKTLASIKNLRNDPENRRNQFELAEDLSDAFIYRYINDKLILCSQIEEAKLRNHITEIVEKEKWHSGLPSEIRELAVYLKMFSKADRQQLIKDFSADPIGVITEYQNKLKGTKWF